MDNYDLEKEGVKGAGRLSVLEYQTKRPNVNRSFNNVYVKNFPKDYTETDLTKIFEHYGPLSNVHIMKDEDGISKGFGFVCYRYPHDAERAIIRIPEQLASANREK